MGGAGPRVSIGLPVYNGENYVQEALDSILGQTYMDWELIICDNASTDGTADICRKYAARDARIHYHLNERNLGAAPNYNRTLELAVGEYFKWAAHDDLLAPQFLARCVEALDQHPQAVLCHPKSRIIDERGQWIEDYDVHLRMDSPQPQVRFHDLIWVRHWCLQVFGLMRREKLLRTRLHGDYASADRVLLVELALLGPFCKVPEYLFFSRRHGRQASQLVYDLHSYARWFGPQGSEAVFPASRLAWEHFRAVRDAPIRPGQRARCYWSGLLRLGKFAGILVKDVTVPLKRMWARERTSA